MWNKIKQEREDTGGGLDQTGVENIARKILESKPPYF